MRRTACVLTFAALTACTTMVPVTAPQEYIANVQPSRIWVTRADKSVEVVEAPRLFGDTLTGFVGGEYQEMLLADVRSVSTRRRAGGRTVLLVGGAVLVGGVVVAMIAGSGPDGGQPSDEDPVTPGAQRARP